MPKETIQNPYPDEQPFRAVVGWTRDCDVQLGIQVQDETSTLLDRLYGGETSREGIGRVLIWWVREELPKIDLDAYADDDTLAASLGSLALGWVEANRGYTPERDGIWVNLTRTAINDLIRLSRRGRDQAYGRDE